MPFSPFNSKIKSFCDSQIQLPIVSSETRERIISLSTLFPACPQESQVSTAEVKARPKECFQSCNKQHGLNSYQNNNICALTRYIHTKKLNWIWDVLRSYIWWVQKQDNYKGKKSKSIIYLVPSKVEGREKGGASGKESPCQCKRNKRCRFNPWVFLTQE